MTLLAAVVVVILLALIGVLFTKTIIISNRFQKGLVLYENQDYAGAIALFEQVIAQQASNDLARLLLGNALMKQGNLEAATAVFDDLIDRSPQNVDAYLSLGKALMRQGAIQAAIAQFKKAARIKPNKFAEPYRVLGLALKEQGQLDDAIAALTKAKSLYQAQSATEFVELVEQDLQQIEQEKGNFP